jgi:elongation factor P
VIEAGDLKKGVTLKLDGTLYRVVNTVYNKPGRGTASMRATLLDINTEQTSQRVFGIEERLENVFVESEPVEFLYRDGHTLHFMNPTSYEQYEVDETLFGDDVAYLKENLAMELRLYEGRPIDYDFPTSVVYKIVDAEVAVAGDTAGNTLRKATTEGGLVLNVPLFVNVGDNIKVDTRDGSYLGRA